MADYQNTITLDDANALIGILRNAGYAVTIFTPEEVGEVSHDNIEDAMIRAGNDQISDAQEQSKDCAEGMHSWIDETGRLAADTACTRCGENYGEPD